MAIKEEMMRREMMDCGALEATILLTNVYVNDGQMLITIDLPGVDVPEVSIIDDEIIIRCRRKMNKVGFEHVQGMISEDGLMYARYSLFTPVPVDTSSLKTSFENGVLSIIIARLQERSVPVDQPK